MDNFSIFLIFFVKVTPSLSLSKREISSLIHRSQSSEFTYIPDRTGFKSILHKVTYSLILRCNIAESTSKDDKNKIPEILDGSLNVTRTSKNRCNYSILLS